jgi:N,N'-diacetylbacillosaminyl-diphospho-undecaprenol alpha-1,3-N-acetylgalactosaminyltransferase
MKIAFVSHLDRNLYHFRLPIMKELIKNGHEVYAVMPKGDFSEKFDEFGITVIHYYVNRGSLNPFNELSTIYKLYKLLKEFEFDIIHGFTIKPNLYTVVIGKLLGVKVIICTVTGLGSFYISKNLKAKIIKKTIELLYKIAFKFSSKIVFQNSDDITLYRSLNLVTDNNSILIKSSGIDTKEFCIENINEKELNNLKEELQIKNDDIIILMVARAIYHKGTLEYLEASKYFNNRTNVRFLYAGSIDKGNPTSLTESIMNSYNIEWLGYRTDIKNLCAICDIFVLPSYREGIPRTLLEAGAMEKPIVTTNAVGCKEVVDDGKNGFKVAIGDSKELSEKIAILVDNKNMRKKFGEYSKQKVINEFGIEYVVTQYMNVYNEVLYENNQI